MVNKVILIGHLGQDPEIRYTQNNNKIASFSMATSEYWKDKSTGERKSITQWHKIVVFNEALAGIVESYVKKGTKLYIEGSLQSRKYTGNDGIERNVTEIVLSQFKGELQILDSREMDSSNIYSNSGYSNQDSGMDEMPSMGETKKANSKKEVISNVGDDLDDEIPF